MASLHGAEIYCDFKSTCSSTTAQTLVSDLGVKVTRVSRMPHFLLLFLLLFWVLPPVSAKRIPTNRVLTNPFQIQEKINYYKSGDLIIGGNLLLVTIISPNKPDFQKNPHWLPFRIL